MTRPLSCHCTSVFASLLLLPLAQGCTKLTGTRTTDHRSHPTNEAPAAPPPTEPSTGPEPSPADPADPAEQKEPGKPVPSGIFELGEVHCPERVIEPAKLVLRLVNVPSSDDTDEGAYLERRDATRAPECVTRQAVGLTMTDMAMKLVLGGARCDGACTAACAPNALGDAGTEIAAEYTPVSGGFSLAIPGLKLPDHCAGATPASLAFDKTGDGECPRIWQGTGANRDGLSLHQLHVLDGHLRWSAETLPKGQTFALGANRSLSGDFSVQAEVTSFGSGGGGAFFRLRLGAENQPAQQAYAELGTSSGDGSPHLRAAIVPGVPFDAALHAKTVTRPAPGGTLTVSKLGTVLTVTAKSGSKTTERQLDLGAALGNGPFRLLLELGNAHLMSAVPQPSAVSVAAVAVKDGAGDRIAPSDAFDCSSVTP